MASRVRGSSLRRISGSISSAPGNAQVGERENLLPFIVIAYDAERRPLLLLPLVLRHERGVRTACFMGGKHATFNMALWDRDFAASITIADLDTLLSAIRSKSVADVLALTQQPLRWRESPNPMALLPNQPSANDCPLMTMVSGAPPVARISRSFRGRLKGKERKLQALPGYRYYAASADTEIKRLLDCFLPPQAAADGGAETSQRVRRTRRGRIYPERLHDTAGGRRSRDRHSCSGMR